MKYLLIVTYLFAPSGGHTDIQGVATLADCHQRAALIHAFDPRYHIQCVANGPAKS